MSRDYDDAPAPPAPPASRTRLRARSDHVVRPFRNAPCCGRRTQEPYCCMIDPRAHADGRQRLAGNWCLWCGDLVPEGRSYCGPSCSYSYHDDLTDE